MTTSDGGRNTGERIGALEQDMNTVKYRLDVFDRRHDLIPERVSKVEQAMAHQSEQFDDLQEGLLSIHGKVDKLSKTLTYALGGAAVLMVVLDKAWPIIMKGFGA